MTRYSFRTLRAGRAALHRPAPRLRIEVSVSVHGPQSRPITLQTENGLARETMAQTESNDLNTGEQRFQSQHLDGLESYRFRPFGSLSLSPTQISISF